MPKTAKTDSQREGSRQRKQAYDKQRQQGRGRTPAQASIFSPPFSYELLSTARIDNKYQTRTHHISLQYEILSDSSGLQTGVSFHEFETVFNSFLFQCIQSFHLEQAYYQSPLSQDRRPVDGNCPRCNKEPCPHCCRLDCSESCEWAPADPTTVEDCDTLPGPVQDLFEFPSEIVHRLQSNNPS